jgi:hypothetical protein
MGDKLKAGFPTVKGLFLKFILSDEFKVLNRVMPLNSGGEIVNLEPYEVDKAFGGCSI